MTSALYKDWVVAGLGELTPEQYDELWSRCHAGVKPIRPIYGLTVQYDAASGTFYLSDASGPLVATTNVEAAIMLIVAEGRPNGSASSLLKLHRQPALRINDEPEQYNPRVPVPPEPQVLVEVPDEMKARANRLMVDMRERMAKGPAGSPGSGTDMTVQDGTQVKIEGRG